MLLERIVKNKKGCEVKRNKKLRCGNKTHLWGKYKIGMNIYNFEIQILIFKFSYCFVELEILTVFLNPKNF